MDGGDAKRLTQVNEQLENLERQLKRYEELLVGGNERFKSILKNEPGKLVKDGNEKEDTALVPTAHRLRVLTRTFSDFNERLATMIDRAEN